MIMRTKNNKLTDARAVTVQRLVRVLRLNLKGYYFDAIKDGSKTREYRLADKWLHKIDGGRFCAGLDEIHLLRGYPKRGDESKILRRAWNGYTVETITHPHFGDKPVRVVAIDVTKHPNAELSNPKPEENDGN